MTMRMSMSDKMVDTMRTSIDPSGSMSLDQRRLMAALRKTGLEYEDIDPDTALATLDIHSKVPKDRLEDIQQQRQEIREGLRASRIKKVEECLKKMKDDDVRRLMNFNGGGVRPVKDSDMPPVGELAGMGDIMDLQAKQMEKVAKEQERKANAICTDFLQGKKKADDSDAKIRALEQRLKDYRKAQADYWKQKKNEADKATERRRTAVAAEMTRRAEYEDDLNEKLTNKLNAARAKRTMLYSKEHLKTKTEAAARKREAAFEQACRQEEEMLDRLETRRIEVEERLMENQQAQEEERADRRQREIERFQQKQVFVHAQQQEWVENKLASHDQFMTRCNENKQRGKDFMNERSKSCGSLHKKAYDKWKSNHDRLTQQNNDFNDELLARHEAARRRVEDELKPMKLKCGEDVFSHLEVKEKTFGDLQKRRWAELQKERDAYYQSILFKVAEGDAKKAADDAGKREVFKKRQEATKNTLEYAQHANEVFLKIKAEPDEMKIRAAMEGLGFTMPALPKQEKEGEEQQQ